MECLGGVGGGGGWREGVGSRSPRLGFVLPKPAVESKKEREPAL